MSLLSPIFTYRTSEIDTSPDRVVVKDFRLPALDRADEIRIMPLDQGIGRVASEAVKASGAEIFQAVYKEKDPIAANSRAVRLAEHLVALGNEAAHSLDPILSNTKFDSGSIAKIVAGEQEPFAAATVPVVPEFVDKRIEELWKEKAVSGEEAMVTLLALRDLAVTRHNTFDGNVAASVLEHIHPDDSRIILDTTQVSE